MLHAWSLPLSRKDAALLGAESQHRALIEAAASALRRRHPELPLEVELENDNPVAALAAAGRRSSLIVIGTHRRGILAGGWGGSVSMDLIGTLTTPVCVVPNHSAGRR